MNTVEKTFSLLNYLSKEERCQAIKFVPKNGNVYVYQYPKGATLSQIQKFVKYVEFLTNEHTSTFIEMDLLCTDADGTATFTHFLSDEYHHITVDKSKIVIVV
jgi:hypothetical protein